MYSNEYGSIGDIVILLKNIAIKHSKIEKGNTFKKIKDLEFGIKQLDTLLENTTDDNLMNLMIRERDSLKDEIDQLYKIEIRSAIIRSKCEILSNNENPSTNFLREETRNAKRTLIKGLMNENGSISKTTNENLVICKDFYEKLYN